MEEMKVKSEGKKPYFIGLDMGTNSVGWAVTDNDYCILRKKGKDLWGVRLFDEAKTAATRRTNRVNRRRLQRKKNRIKMLNDFFAPLIIKGDPSFFERIEDSKYYQEDKRNNTPFVLFADSSYTDKEYYKDFPTVFHLRQAIINEKLPIDNKYVKLVYIAILSIFQHRGHFLNENLSDEVNANSNYNELINQMKLCKDTFMLNLEIIDNEKFDQIMSDKKMTRKDKSLELKKLLTECGDKEDSIKIKEIANMLCGLQTNIVNLFEKEIDEMLKISFDDSDYEQQIIEIENSLTDEELQAIIALKQIHDYYELKKIMGDAKYLSEARVNLYNKHKNDLKILKKLIKEYAPDKYSYFFREMNDSTYSAYVKSVNSSCNGKIRRGLVQSKQRTKEALYKEIKDILNISKVKKPEDITNEQIQYIYNEIENNSFLPKQITNENGVIPNQVHANELRTILEIASKNIPYLCSKDDKGIELKNKIYQLLTFRIPYYVGPVYNANEKDLGNNKAQYSNAWSVRKKEGKVYPWNFDEMIDIRKSSEIFIERMTNNCTYLPNEKALPKNSLLLEKFNVLNELNNLCINGTKISEELKQKIYLELFETGKKITNKKMIDFLVKNGLAEKDVSISGIDKDFKSTLANHKFFKEVFNVDILQDRQYKIAEDIIYKATIYGDSKKFLKELIEEKYPNDLSKEQIKRILSKKFNGWGKLSKKLLTDIKGADVETGEAKTIMQRMWDENYNFMQLVGGNSQFNYKDIIEEQTKKIKKELIDVQYEDLEDLYLSPSVKRMTWQTILILKELIKVMGYNPSKIFVEMARESETDKKRTISRKNKILSSYKSLEDKEERKKWEDFVNSKKEQDFKIKKLYLYCLQLGKCMYTGETIDINSLFDDSKYDIDHIIPRCYKKDDSIENNLVLVKKSSNALKTDKYPIDNDIISKMQSFWYILKEKGLISEEKYKRLVRKEELSEDEKADFISRQLVETRQGTKAIATLLKNTNKDVEIVYSKADAVSDFRHKFSIVKCREINDFHHAHDAYLNIVVGNSYNVKFTNSPIRFIKEEYKKDRTLGNYHMDKIFNKTIERDGIIAWDTNGNKSINTVRLMLSKNSPLVTYKSYIAKGPLFDATLYSHEKVKEDGYIPIKSNDEKMKNIKKYGGYCKATGAYFFLADYVDKNKRIRVIEAKPLYLHNCNTKIDLQKYCEDVLGYKSVNVILEHIPMYTLIKLNGIHMYLSGRKPGRLIVINAEQLKLKSKSIEYIKKIIKFKNDDCNDSINSSINKENNLSLYDEFVEKMTNSIYGYRPNSLAKLYVEKRQVFNDLNVNEQIKVLINTLDYFTRTNKGVDLTIFNAGKGVGECTTNNKINANKEFKCIFQSVTGLYEIELDLLKL